MKKHIEHIQGLIDFTLQEVESHRVVEILNERITRLAKTYILKRDIDNFVSYFLFVLSSPKASKQVAMSIKLVSHFVQRTYAGFDVAAQDQQARIIYEFIKKQIGDGAVINGKNLGVLRNALKEEGFTFDKLKERIVIGLLLKWLQGPIKNNLSDALNDYIAFLATTFGQFESNRIINFETEDFKIGKDDLAALAIEYGFFETTLLDAQAIIKKAVAETMKNTSLRDQFRFVFDSLDRLMKNAESGALNELSSFRDKIIVSISLIYLQDDFVRKDPDVQELINLFVSLYFRFRDQRLTPTA